MKAKYIVLVPMSTAHPLWKSVRVADILVDLALDHGIRSRILLHTDLFTAGFEALISRSYQR